MVCRSTLEGLGWGAMGGWLCGLSAVRVFLRPEVFVFVADVDLAGQHERLCAGPTRHAEQDQQVPCWCESCLLCLTNFHGPSSCICLSSSGVSCFICFLSLLVFLLLSLPSPSPPPLSVCVCVWCMHICIHALLLVYLCVCVCVCVCMCMYVYVFVSVLLRRTNQLP